MSIAHETKGNAFIITVQEEDLTDEILDRMRQVLTVAFLHKKYHIILDLSSCKMIDSYFIGLLISTYREVKELGGTLSCVGAAGQVKNAFEVIRLDRLVKMHNSLADALADIPENSQIAEE